MHLPNPNLHAPRAPEPPAFVRVVSRADVTWNRPVFKAPPLEVVPPKLDVGSVADEFRRAMRSDR